MKKPEGTVIRQLIEWERDDSGDWLGNPEITLASPQTIKIETDVFYNDGTIRTYEASSKTVTQRIRPAHELDALLAADMREVFQRDYQRRQEHAAKTGEEPT